MAKKKKKSIKARFAEADQRIKEAEAHTEKLINDHQDRVADLEARHVQQQVAKWKDIQTDLDEEPAVIKQLQKEAERARKKFRAGHKKQVVANGKKQREFERALKEYNQLGYAEAFAKHFHNPPAIRFRVAEPELEANLSDPVGADPTDLERVGPPSSRAFAQLVRGDAGFFNTNKIVASVTADAGWDENRSYVEATANPVMTFRHDPPEVASFCHHVYVVMCLNGIGTALYSQGIFGSTSEARRSGGVFHLSYSMTLTQVHYSASGSASILTFPLVAREPLASGRSYGGIFQFGPWAFPVWSDPVRSSIVFSPVKEYPLPIRIYGTHEEDPALGRGGPLELKVEFNLTASARNRNARASIRFDEPGQILNVSEVVLDCT